MDLKTANRLLELRKEHGYSQDALAEKIGVSRQAVSKWERAESSPDTDNLISLANLYGITLDELLNNSKDGAFEPASPSQSKDVKEKVKTVVSKVSDYGLYPRAAAAMMKFPFPILVVIIYAGLSFAFDIWHPLWIIFLAIPIYYQTALACKANNKKAFCLLLPFPEIIVAIYLIASFATQAWNSTWILFLAIPIYYWIAAFLVKNKN